MVFLTGRDLGELANPQFDYGQEFSPARAVMAGRAIVAVLLILAAASCLAWFTSKRRGLAAVTGSAPDVDGRTDAGRRGAAVGSRRRRSKGRAGSHGGQRSGTRSVKGVQGGLPLSIHWLLALALLHHFICSVLPGFFVADFRFQLGSFYVGLAVLALFAGRRLPHRRVLDAVMWSLAAFMVSSLLLYFFMPQSTSSVAGLEQRIPFIETRFWGLGASPNSIAPLAVVQLALQLHSRRHLSFLSAVMHAIAAMAAIVVLVWSQSQTAWAAAALVLPFIAIRSRLAPRASATSIQPQHVVFGLVIVVFAVAFLGSELIRTDAWDALMDKLPGQRSEIWKSDSIQTATAIGDQMMTGRGRIWAVAVDAWRESPWLGFGGDAWQSDFRHYYGVHHGVHAHNQFLQAMSVSGLLGLTVLLCYLTAMAWFAWKTSAASRGLTLALFMLILVRMVTEVPLDSVVLTSADTATHLLLLYLLFAYGGQVGRGSRAGRSR